MNEILEMRKPYVTFSQMQEADFNKLLQEMNDTDHWIETNALHMKVIAGTLYVELGTSRSKRFELHPQAWISVLRRSGLTIEEFDAYSPKELAVTLNIALRKKAGPFKVLIRGGKVLAVHTARYIPFPQKRIVSSLKSNVLEGKYEKIVFAGSTYTHERTSVCYEVISSRLLSAYKTALNAAGIASKDVRAFVEISTGDAGVTSVTLTPSLSLNHSERVLIGEPVSIKHRDNMTFAKCEEEMTRIFAAMSDGVENMRRLLGIELTYPSSVAIKIAKNTRKWNLPSGIIRELDPEFKIPEMMGITMSAHQFWLTLCEMFQSEGFNKLTPQRQFKIKESIARIALMKEAEWQNLDVNDVCW